MGYKNFVDKAESKFPNRYEFPFIETEYTNNKCKVTIKCKRCGATFMKRPNDFLMSKNGGCKCYVRDIIDYETLISQITGNKIVPFDGYKSITKDKVIAICDKHGEYTMSLYSVSRNSYTCPQCARAKSGKPTSIDEVKKRLRDKFGYDTLIDESTYTKMSSPATFICRICGKRYRRRPQTLFNYGKDYCKDCANKEYNESRTKSTEQFIAEAQEKYGDKFDFSETVYYKSSQKVTIKCNECGRTFSIEANSFLMGHGCPFHNLNASSKEKEIALFIKSISDEEVITSDRSLLDGLELDIYLPKHQVAIEFDGVFWHNENCKDINYHINKTNLCKEKGVRLIHIFEDEWIEKPQIWKSMLRNLLGQTKIRIFARKCIVKEISWQDCNDFVNENHLQGKCSSSIHLGLFYNEELVSVMSFGKSRHFIGNGKMQYELMRFCNKIDTNVIGGASKLWSYFLKTYNPISVISYADRRWSIGNLYERLGFTLARISKPNYFYVIKDKRYNRFNFRKSILVKKYGCPPEMTEKEFCYRQKWYRIYDCGCLCYEYVKS